MISALSKIYITFIPIVFISALLYLFSNLYLIPAYAGSAACSSYYGSYYCIGNLNCNNGGNGSCGSAICGSPDAFTQCKSGTFPINEGGCNTQCGSGGGSGGAGSSPTPVWVRVLQKGAGGQTIAWRPAGALNQNGVYWSGTEPGDVGGWGAGNPAPAGLWRGSGPDSNGNFTRFSAYSDFVALGTLPDIIRNPKTFDLNKNKIGTGMQLYTANIYASEPFNWSNAFCPGGRAVGPDATGKYIGVQDHQNNFSCPALPSHVLACGPDVFDAVDGCGGLFKTQWPGREPGFYIDYLNSLMQYADGNTVLNGNLSAWVPNPFAWADIRFDEYWTLSYPAYDTYNGGGQSAGLTLTPPTGYRCKQADFYGMGNSGTPQYGDSSTSIIYSSDGKCTVNADLKNRGNLILFEIEPISGGPVLAAPVGTIVSPSVLEDKFCPGSGRWFNYQAKSNGGFNITDYQVYYKEVGIGAWKSFGIGNDPVDPDRSMFSALNFNAPDFLPGHSYYVSMTARDAQPSPQSCSSNPEFNFSSAAPGFFYYCGTPSNTSTPSTDVAGDKPWRRFSIVNTALSDITGATVTPVVGGMQISWNFVNTIGVDLLGFTLYRHNNVTGLDDLVVPYVIPPSPTNTYSITDFIGSNAAVCNGVTPVSYKIYSNAGYRDKTQLNNPVQCGQKMVTAANICTPNATPTCTITPRSATYIQGSAPVFDFTTSTANSKNVLENDIAAAAWNISVGTATPNYSTVTQLNNYNRITDGVLTFGAANTPVINAQLTLIDTQGNSFTCSGSATAAQPKVTVISNYNSTTNKDPNYYCANRGNSASVPPLESRYRLWGGAGLSKIDWTFPLGPTQNIIPGDYKSTLSVEGPLATTDTSREIKCVIVEKKSQSTGAVIPPAFTTSTNFSAVQVNNVAATQDLSVTIVYGPVLNENWFQTRSGDIQYGLNQFALPQNQVNVLPAYKVGLGVYLFSTYPAATPPVGTILSFSEAVSKQYPESIAISNPSGGSKSHLINDTLNKLAELKDASTTTTLANCSAAPLVNSALNGGRVFKLPCNTFNPGGNVLSSNLLSDSSKNVPVILANSGNGDFTLSKNITWNSTVTGNKKYPILYVNGNLTIDASVTSIDAFVIVKGDILVRGNVDPAEKQLVVNGSLIAGGNITFERDFQNVPLTQNNMPGVLVNYDPKIYFMKNIKNFSTMNTYVSKYD